MSIVTTSPASDARSRRYVSNELSPTRLHVRRHARKAVTRQVDEASAPRRTRRNSAIASGPESCSRARACARRSRGSRPSTSRSSSGRRTRLRVPCRQESRLVSQRFSKKRRSARATGESARSLLGARALVYNRGRFVSHDDVNDDPHHPAFRPLARRAAQRRVGFAVGRRLRKAPSTRAAPSPSPAPRVTAPTATA